MERKKCLAACACGTDEICWLWKAIGEKALATPVRKPEKQQYFLLTWQLYDQVQMPLRSVVHRFCAGFCEFEVGSILKKTFCWFLSVICYDSSFNCTLLILPNTAKYHLNTWWNDAGVKIFFKLCWLMCTWHCLSVSSSWIWHRFDVTSLTAVQQEMWKWMFGHGLAAYILKQDCSIHCMTQYKKSDLPDHQFSFAWLLRAFL